MPSPHIPTYRKYVNAFREFDYVGMEDTYLTFADSVGVFPDVSYLLYSFVASPNVKTVVEIGAGMSTCVLGHAAAKYGKLFTVVESSSVWVAHVSKALLACGVPVPEIINTDGLDKPPVLPMPIDFMWVDGCILPDPTNMLKRIDGVLHYKEDLQDAILCFDDAQYLKEDIARLRDRFPLKDRSECWYNPTDRWDRHVFISVPDSKKFALDIVSQCLGVYV